MLDVKGNIVTKDEEKAEVLHAFLASVFSNKTSCCQDAQPPELEDRLGAEGNPHNLGGNGHQNAMQLRPWD